MNALREVGACNCMEHQARDRMVALIRQLSKEVDEARQLINELRQSLNYWKEASIEEEETDQPQSRK